MTEEQNKLAEEIERQLRNDSSLNPSIMLGEEKWVAIIAALREPATEAVLEEVVKLRDIVLGEGEPGWQVWLEIGNQHFPVGNAYDVQSEAEWYAEMLRKAITALKGKGASQGEAHTDHPVRFWDRTCPACIAEGLPDRDAFRAMLGRRDEDAKR